MGMDGRIYVFGGYDARFNTSGPVEAYNPGSNTWTTLAPLPTPVLDAAAVTGAGRSHLCPWGLRQ